LYSGRKEGKKVAENLLCALQSIKKRKTEKQNIKDVLISNSAETNTINFLIFK
jgi:hypothetical protein